MVINTKGLAPNSVSGANYSQEQENKTMCDSVFYKIKYKNKVIIFYCQSHISDSYNFCVVNRDDPYLMYSGFTAHLGRLKYKQLRVK